MTLDKTLLIISSWNGYHEAKSEIQNGERTFGSIHGAWHKRTLPTLLQKLKPSVILIDNQALGNQSTEIEQVAVEMTETFGMETKIFHLKSETPGRVVSERVFHIKEVENLFEHV